MRMPGVARLLGRYERGRRFWRHVRVGGPDEHWFWEGDLDAEGRPSFAGAPAAAYAYELARGSAPNGRAIEQRCGEGRCVNPEHLRPVPPVP